MRQVLIVGAGLGGLRAAQRLRERGFDGDITIVGDEQHKPYNRPPLSKQVLAGEQDCTECTFDHDDAQANWILGNRAVGLDIERRAVALQDGSHLSYDGLIIATGRRARPWPTALPPLRGFHTLRGIDDTCAFAAEAVPGRRVVIVGGGFIGCEVAATLRQRGLTDVTIIEIAPHLVSVLGARVGDFAGELHRKHGVVVECGIGVKSFHGDAAGRIASVELADGRHLRSDVVLLALGSMPNTEWLNDSGLVLDAGAVVCDPYCFALERDDIVAVGDVATWTHLGVGRPVRVEHWSNAVEMGRAAADNLLAGRGCAEPFTPVPTFWSDQYDVKLKAAGFASLADDYVVVERDDDAGKLVVEASHHGKPIAAITCNHTKAYLKYRSQLKQALEGTPEPTTTPR